MSLINDALKKAQRERGGESETPFSLSRGKRARIAKRSSPWSVNALLALIAGGIALVVLSAVGAAIWVAREKASPPRRPGPAAVAAIPRPAPVQPRPAAAPVIVLAPLAEGSRVHRLSGPGPLTAAPAGAPAVGIIVVPRTVAVAVAPRPNPSGGPAAASRPPGRDEQLQALIDGFRIAGVRESGEASKVLMNDHVYRIDEIVDLPSGLKLTKVTADTLTFVDPSGVTYLKHF